MCNKNKQIDRVSNTMSKGYNVFTENFTTSFSIGRKTEKVPEFEFGRF